MLRTVFLSFAAAAALAATALADSRPVVTTDPIAPWFEDARFGIFIHWGVYAVDGNGASWPIFNHKVSYEDYMAQCKKFTASKYDPEAWAKLFKEAGARYAVLTTKHHDGIALWDTKQKSGGKILSVVKCTPARRDLVGPFVKAMRKAGLKVGLYFSHLDWSNPDYRAFPASNPENFNEFRDSPDGKKHPDWWKRFLKFHRAQLHELCTLYHPDLLWFDGDWDHSADVWKMEELRAQLKKWCPGVVLNSRMGGYGDYATPEQGLPTVPPKGPWELCMTMGPGWGYREQLEHQPNQQIPAECLIRILAECAGMGGNLLLNVSPRPDGTIPEWQQERLRVIGAWLKLNGEAVYGTRAGIPFRHYAAPSTLSKDRKTLYLFFFCRPSGGLMVKGLHNKPRKIEILGAPRAKVKLRNVGGAAWNHVPPSRFFMVPEDLPIGTGRVLKLEFDEPVRLYGGKSGAISQN